MSDSKYIVNINGDYVFMKPMSDDDIVKLALAIVKMGMHDGELFTHSQAIKSYLLLNYGQLEHEIFSCLLLDNCHYLLHHEDLFRGTIDGAIVYPREVIKLVMAHNASCVIFAHNHPSGEATPSRSDIAITDKLKKALDLIDVRVLDHFVVGKDEVVSFAERGLL